jgi:hypothetical protein
MSEDADAREQEAAELLAAERDAFEARFPPEAFTGIAKALKIHPTPENLSRLRGWLLGDFYGYLYFGLPSREPTRKEQIARLKQLFDAARTLHSAISVFEDVWPLNLLGPAGPFATDDATDQFTATLQVLADTSAGQIEKLASRKSRRGRPPKNEPFQELTPRLVRKYERFTKEPAGPPNWIPNSGIWRGKGSFYPFARAVWCCLRDNLPAEARAAIPSTEEGLAQELKKHWPKVRRVGKNPH